MWGVLGDKMGRTSVLFATILLYSVANIANAYVETISGYAFWRFLAGLGLAGELGAGITLVSEITRKDIRGYASTFVAFIGLLGGVAAALTADLFPWRTAYIVGGVMGLALLVLRFAVMESGLFEKLKTKTLKRGSLIMLLSKRDRVKRYVLCLLSGAPIWFVVGLIVTFSPEIAAAMQVKGQIKPGTALLYSSLGVTMGDLAAGLLMQLFRSGRKVMLAFIAGGALYLILFFNMHGIAERTFYWMVFPMGFLVGYWAVFVLTSAEQFGTNLRATVTTTTPNFVRGLTVPITSSFLLLTPKLGVVHGALVIGLILFAIAFVATFLRSETFGRDLDFIER